MKKVQVNVDDAMWKQAKAAAALRGESLGEFVGQAIGQFVAGLDKRLTADPKPKATKPKGHPLLSNIPIG